jgi:Spy/CpxP family protein refolding chaperone
MRDDHNRKGNTMSMKTAAIASAIALGVVGVAAYGHGYGYGMMGPGFGGYGMGPGMMGGYGGYGPGGGMMGGYGGYRMGPGAMGGYGGYGMGPGAFGGIDSDAIARLGLNDQQRSQVTTIQDAVRKTNREVMDKMHDEMVKLRSAANPSGKKDWDAVLAANRRMSELRQQLAENSIKATRDIEAVLTPEQRARFEQRYSRPCFDDD